MIKEPLKKNFFNFINMKSINLKIRLLLKNKICKKISFFLRIFLPRFILRINLEKYFWKKIKILF